MTKGILMNYRGSHHTQNPKQMIIQPEGSASKADAEKFVGKHATWTSRSGKKITGLITAPHGGNGAVRVRFDDKGLPGQSLGTQIEIA
jgi:ribosomal protein L35AE/L33A